MFLRFLVCPTIATGGHSFMNLSNMHDRLLAKDSNLSQFEIAQLANLCCDDSEEAKALIPR
jgi:DNA-directed RNA polymerase II subunit RPB4